MTPEQKLAERIQHELDMGFRVFTLKGAELDWVVAALRRTAVEQATGEPSGDKT